MLFWLSLSKWSCFGFNELSFFHKISLGLTQLNSLGLNWVLNPCLVVLNRACSWLKVIEKYWFFVYWILLSFSYVILLISCNSSFSSRIGIAFLISFSSMELLFINPGEIPSVVSCWVSLKAVWIDPIEPIGAISLWSPWLLPSWAAWPKLCCDSFCRDSTYFFAFEIWSFLCWLYFLVYILCILWATFWYTSSYW